jgi:hypothetical protein
VPAVSEVLRNYAAASRIGAVFKNLIIINNNKNRNTANRQCNLATRGTKP